MSFGLLKKKVQLDEAYGGGRSRAKEIWGEGKEYTKKSWKPRARFPQLEELIATFKQEDVAIAGGSILGAWTAIEFGDIDVFPLNREALDIARAKLIKLGYKLDRKEEHCEYYCHPESICREVQLVKAHTDLEGDVNRLLDRFDLSVVQVAVYKGRLRSNTIAEKDIKKGRLRCTGTLSINAFWHRVEKYKKRGFKLEDD